MGMPLKLRLLLWWDNFKEKKPLHEMEAHDARTAMNEKMGSFDWLFDWEPISMEKVEDCKVYMRDSEQISLRIYQPTKGKNLPVIIYFHGGGFVFNDLDSHDKVCRRVAKNNEAIVFAVDYRLAPEYKFPTPIHDSYDATLWVAKNAAKFNGDPNRITLMGDSAGANLATVTCVEIRDKGGPKIANQVLIYPCTDARMGHPSIDKYAEGYALTKKLMQWFINNYTQNESDVLDPRMSPFLTKNLSNLPPAFVLTAGFDPLKDEGFAYAERLKEAGNNVKYQDYSDTIHGFFSIPKLMTKSLDAHKDIQEFIQKNSKIQAAKPKKRKLKAR